MRAENEYKDQDTPYHKRPDLSDMNLGDIYHKAPLCKIRIPPRVDDLHMETDHLDAMRYVTGPIKNPLYK